MFCQGHYDCYHPYLLPAQSRIWQPVGHLIKAIAPAELVGTMMVHLMYVGFNAHSDVRPSWDLITSCQRGGWHTVTAYPPFHTLHTILIPPPYPVIKHGDQNKAWLTLDFLQLGLVHALPFFALKIFLRHKQSSSLNSQVRRCKVSDIWVTSYKLLTSSQPDHFLHWCWCWGHTCPLMELWNWQFSHILTAFIEIDVLYEIESKAFWKKCWQCLSAFFIRPGAVL